MNLYELRKLLNMTQLECANYLHISLRSYNEYENNPNKFNTRKYFSYCKILQNHINELSVIKNSNFKTDVIIGDPLEKSIQTIKTFKKRDCFNQLIDYINNKVFGKVCILYGLRRTGKTTLMFQAISTMDLNKTAYIKANNKCTMADLSSDLHLLSKLGYKYVFIDEITSLNDFIDTAAILSDIYAQMGIKIILSGIDSLSFAIASKSELYDRAILIHTTHIPYDEYNKIFTKSSIDSYIENGGIFPNINSNDITKYLDSAIALNIEHTLNNYNNGEYLNQFTDFFYDGKLTAVINKVIEKLNYDFIYGTLSNKEDKILERLKYLIEVKDKEYLKIKIEKEHVEKVKIYLLMLDLINNIPVKIEDGSDMPYYIFVQPGMRYSIAKALIESLKEDIKFKKMFGEDQNYVIDKILNDVKGKMLEDIVLLETNYYLNDNSKAFKYKFSEGGEFDMVIEHNDFTCSIFEIKHSNKININQTKNLLDENKCNSLSEIYGKIIKKCVLYRGEDKIVDGIEYKNVENYLLNIKNLNN